MCIVVMLSICMNIMAEETNTANAEAFSLNINTKALVRTLETTEDQNESIVEVMKIFNSQTALIAVEDNEETRKALMRSALKDNIRLMKNILTRRQMKKYLTIINVTMVNRHLLPDTAYEF